jgi:hypothetical protein
MEYDYHQEHARELNNLPKPYPIEMAINNNDIVENHSDPYNTERFFKFLSNAEQGMPDKVRITRYGFDNPELATKTILEYNSNIFIFTISGDQVPPITYYGHAIIYRYLQAGNWWQYFLRKSDGGEELVFTLYN